MLSLLRKLKILAYAAYAGLALIAFTPVVHAAPFGQGQFGADVGFGSATSLSVALNGTVSLNLTSNGSYYSASGAHSVTVTSSDPVGYALYAYALDDSTMVSPSSGDTIPASTNSSAGPLGMNTWGYNLDGSSNFMGLSTTPSVIKTSLGPFETGDTTNVTYGVKTDLTKTAGSYKVSVVYTAACLSQ